jgi:hypothetical protein
MKLKYFSEQTLPKFGGGTRNGSPKINFGKSGTITINRFAAKLMELNADDKITIAQDEDDPANWYLFKDSQHGFLVRGKKAQDGQTGDLQFNHKGLLLEICKACEISDEQSHNFLIAGQATMIKGDKTKYWGLLQKAKV